KRDWSSDVCSSDLDPRLENEFGAHPLRQRPAILAQSVAVPPPMPACAASEASSRTSSPGSPAAGKTPGLSNRCSGTPGLLETSSAPDPRSVLPIPLPCLVLLI